MSDGTRFRKWLRWASARHQGGKYLLVGIATTAVLFQWGRMIRTPRGDFVRHWEFARRFAAGELLYAGGLDVPYPPFWAMAHAPCTLLPISVVEPLVYPLGVAALALLLFLLHRLTSRHLQLGRQAVFWTTAATVTACSRFIWRDFDECGPNLALVALAWLAIYFWICRSELVGGVFLGLAIALKCTSALLLAYFVWKRQWKFVAATAAASLAFTLAPAVWQGSSQYARHVRIWTLHARRGLAQKDPSLGVLGAEPVTNKSLRPVLARFLMHLPAGHPGRVGHAWYVDVLDLSPSAAAVVVNVVLLLLLAGLAWLFRQSVERRNEPAILWECAAVSILILLYSPITWEQHCVGIIPAVYMITRTATARHGVARWMTWSLAVCAFFALVPNRLVVGGDLSLLLESYHPTTWSLLILLVVTLGCWARSFRAPADAEDVTIPTGAELDVRPLALATR